MDGTIMIVAVVAIGCFTGIVTTFIEKVFGGKQKALSQELKVSEDRVRMLEAQLVESHRHNEMMQKQLEWHTKMLETQDRLMKQLGSGDGADSPELRERAGSRT